MLTIQHEHGPKLSSCGYLAAEVAVQEGFEVLGGDGSVRKLLDVALEESFHGGHAQLEGKGYMCVVGAREAAKPWSQAGRAGWSLSHTAPGR